MSAAALLSELRRRDIRVRADGDQLRCSAPAGALTDELREQLARYKADLIALLASAPTLAGQGRALVPLQPRGARVPIFGVPGHNGDVFCYRALARRLGEEQPFYGLQPPGLDGAEAPLPRVEALAGYYARQIVELRGTGSCIVAGYCAGGAVAFELARELSARGVPVRFLALFGAPYPLHFTRPVQLWLGLRKLALRARALAAAEAAERRAYVAERFLALRARREARQAMGADPVLMRRAAVEQATLEAVRRYRPGPWRGRLALFLPGPQWQQAGVLVRRWHAAADGVDTYFGPEASTGWDMLREPHAAAFAELFRRSYGRGLGGSSEGDGPG